MDLEMHLPGNLHLLIFAWYGCNYAYSEGDFCWLCACETVLRIQAHGAEECDASFFLSYREVLYTFSYDKKPSGQGPLFIDASLSISSVSIGFGADRNGEGGEEAETE